MNRVGKAVYWWFDELSAAWNRFWFTAIDPATLSIIRIFTGLLLFYTHLIWSQDLTAFFGPEGWMPAELIAQTWETQGGGEHYFWSHLIHVQSPVVLWGLHLVALLIFFMLTAGLFSRCTAVLAFLLTVSYMHRAAGALFGLDQINVMLTMYLIIGPCGARFSLDAWRKNRGGEKATAIPTFSVAANVAIRLIQIHMCIIYFFAGARKMLGASWWEGSAMWLSIANYEYQSIDLTWLADWPLLLAFLTHLTVLFELFYCALIWNRLTRPLVLLAAVVMHLGIATCLGMATFGLAMLIGNLAFIPPAFILAMRSGRGEKRLALRRGG